MFKFISMRLELFGNGSNAHLLVDKYFTQEIRIHGLRSKPPMYIGVTKCTVHPSVPAFENMHAVLVARKKKHASQAGTVGGPNLR